jgi:hypothetical protein
MYRSVPLSLIAIHFVGLPVSGALVSVPVSLPLTLDSALFVVSKTDPPTTVMPPLAVSRPVIVVVVVTARVVEQVTAPLKLPRTENTLLHLFPVVPHDLELVGFAARLQFTRVSPELKAMMYPLPVTTST